MQHALQNLARTRAYEEAVVAKYRGAISLAQDNCGLCIMRGAPLPCNHEVYDCPTFETQADRTEFSAFRKAIKFQRNTYDAAMCQKCYTAAFFRTALHGEMVPGPDRSSCPCPNLMIGIFYDIWKTPATRSSVEQAFGVKLQDQASLTRWLVRKNAIHSSNAMAILAWFSNERLGTTHPLY